MRSWIALPIAFVLAVVAVITIIPAGIFQMSAHMLKELSMWVGNNETR